MAEPVARLVRYSGRVQGVGFRVRAVKIAQRYAVAGWVRNLSDGRVELLAEGPADVVAAFLQAIRDYWGDAIEAEERQERPVSGRAAGFTVAR
jgi:acylphosphatase